MDMIREHFRRLFTICEPCRSLFRKNEQKIHRHRKKITTSDPYITFCLAGATVARTRILSNSQNPKWDEHFKIPVAHPVSKIEFQVKDNDVLGAQVIGTASIPVQRISSGELAIDWFEVIGPYGKPPKKYSALYVEIKFTPFEVNPLYRRGVSSDAQNLGVRNTYFPLREGVLVSHYQDAHVPEGMLPEIVLDNGKKYRQG